MDNRFASTPSTVKLAAIIRCIAAAVLTLVIAHRLDRFDGRRARWALPRRWRRVSLLDAVVIGVLLLWHVVGANTADDACQLGMARVSEQAGYMVNYFRYFGVPETPFGTRYYQRIRTVHPDIDGQHLGAYPSAAPGRRDVVADQLRSATPYRNPRRVANSLGSPRSCWAQVFAACLRQCGRSSTTPTPSISSSACTGACEQG